MVGVEVKRGEEVTDDTIKSDDALIWQQAENPLHAQKGLLAWLQSENEIRCLARF
jgi:ornithine carbamoyltransferase